MRARSLPANGDVSADLKTWTFKLRPGLKWSDGQPLNADDVNFTWPLWTGNSKFAAAGSTGFNLITSANPQEWRNFGAEPQGSPHQRYARAREFASVVQGLWDSWDDHAPEAN